MTALHRIHLVCDGPPDTERGCDRGSIYICDTISHLYARAEAALEGWTYHRTTNGQRNIIHKDVCNDCNPHERKRRERDV